MREKILIIFSVLSIFIATFLSWYFYGLPLSIIILLVYISTIVPFMNYVLSVLGGLGPSEKEIKQSIVTARLKAGESLEEIEKDLQIGEYEE